jgi:hypothetical protein
MGGPFLARNANITYLRPLNLPHIVFTPCHKTFKLGGQVPSKCVPWGHLSGWPGPMFIAAAFNFYFRQLLP